MSTSSPEPAALLAALVRTPSVSGSEAAAAALLADWAAASGLDVAVDDAAVRIDVAGADAGPTLWLASHLDTVPAGDGWETDPFGAEVRDGYLHGRGASDAKGSVAAMACAARALARRGIRRGRLVVLATFGEETSRTTMPEARARLGAPDAAIVGEPTGCEPCVAQRGVMILRLRWSGTEAHAGWAARLPGGSDNAVVKAARGIAALAEAPLGRPHPWLGPVSAEVTRIDGGTATNVVPGRCEAVVDVRTVPGVDEEALVAAIAEASGAAVEVVSRRFRPCATPDGSSLLAAVRRALPGCRPFGSPTASDWVFLRDVDVVKLGPGDSRLSHTRDERIRLVEVERAVDAYAGIATAYLA